MVHKKPNVNLLYCHIKFGIKGRQLLQTIFKMSRFWKKAISINYHELVTNMQKNKVG
jgi:hypothetical protein